MSVDTPNGLARHFFLGLSLFVLSISPSAFAERQASVGRCIDYFTAHRQGEVIAPAELCADQVLLRAMVHPQFDRCIRFWAAHPTHGRDDMPSWHCRERRQLDAVDVLERDGTGEHPRKSGESSQGGQQAPALQSHSDRSRKNPDDDVAGGDGGAADKVSPSGAARAP